MDNTSITQINFEIGQIDHLFESYAGLLERVEQNPPDLVELTALASVIHSFYTGLEKIFHIIAKRTDGDVPSGSHWHRDILARMSEETANRAGDLAIPREPVRGRSVRIGKSEAL
ncbi:hypothetical protein QUF72_13185 [Desulfobacterales bacterium HSG2]|nr:hypothetical protein [Desulfobacterales bacterium HSG2]